MGSAYAHYRPSSLLPNSLTTGDPLGTSLGSVYAWITADKDTMGTRPFDAAKPVAYSQHDPAQTQPGDYLVGPLGTFFVGTQDVPMPIQVIRCNYAVAVARPGGSAPSNATPAQPGAYYGGAATITETPIIGYAAPPLTGQTVPGPGSHFWPCSIVQGTKGEQGEVKLPGDVRTPWVAIMFPPLAGGPAILSGDQIIRSDGLRYTASSCELTARGWRITAMLETL